jgi:two-component system KDP operon response regulator KdpE
VLDLGLPDLDGLEVLRQVRVWSEVPVLVVSARGQVDDKVAALDQGANDYLTKPFEPIELLARLRVALRLRAGSPQTPTIELGGLVIDFARHEVTRDAELIRLTPTEFKLLATLAKSAGKVLTHRQLLKEVWGSTNDAQAHTVRVHVAELRKKLEREPARPRWLLTETGIGYRLRDRFD